MRRSWHLPNVPFVLHLLQEAQDRILIRPVSFDIKPKQMLVSSFDFLAYTQ
jgi:hypothetical protein